MIAKNKILRLPARYFISLGAGIVRDKRRGRRKTTRTSLPLSCNKAAVHASRSTACDTLSS